MARTQFEKLAIYRLSEKLADAVWDIVVRWKPFVRTTIGGQLVRAADSIGANVAEGTGRASQRDLGRFLTIARGSLYETKHWLRRAHQRQLLTREQVNLLHPLIDELSPRLNAFIRSLDTPRNQPSTGTTAGNGQKPAQQAYHRPKAVQQRTS